MRVYLVNRILATVPVMMVVPVFVFSLLRLTPGDPAAVIAGDYANPKDVLQIRQKLGLDEPLYRQFGIWMSQLLRGGLGTSIFSGVPVTQLITQRLEPTLVLTLLTLIIAIGLAIPLGTLAAWNVGTWIDRGVMIFAVRGCSLPVFWLAFLLIYAFAMPLSMLPVQGYAHLSQGLLPCLKHLILPALTLGLVYTALIARMTRASMLEVLQEDYIRTASAEGARAWSVVTRHALKNVALPVVTVIGVGVALLIGGAVVTESVFALPGLGRPTVEAILHRDYPVIQGMIAVVSAVCVMVNLLIDLAYAFLDPRIRY